MVISNHSGTYLERLMGNASSNFRPEQPIQR